MSTTIYHNPRCGTSRRVLTLLQERGESPTVVDYLGAPLSRDALAALIARMGVPARDLLRTKEPEYAALGLADPALGDAALIEAMAAHPILMNRPVVVTEKGARLCRPAETVLELLEG